MFGRAKVVNQSFDWVGYGLSLVGIQRRLI